MEKAQGILENLRQAYPCSYDEQQIINFHLDFKKLSWSIGRVLGISITIPYSFEVICRKQPETKQLKVDLISSTTKTCMNREV